MNMLSVVAALMLTCFASTLVWGAESPAEPKAEIQERIEQLERQIRELKELREKQLEKDARTREIKEPCVAAVGLADVCSCLAENLPVGVDFATYARMMSPTKHEVDKRVLEMVKKARERCVR